MARRGSAVQDKPANTEGTEPSTESPNVEATEAVKAETKGEVEIDLTAFEKAVANALAEADESTGYVPEAHIGPVVGAYRGLAGGIKAKNKAKNYLIEGVKAGMGEGSIQKARGYMQLSDALAAPSTKAAKAERVPVDPTEAAVQLDAAFMLARHLVGANVGEEVAEDWSEKAEALAGENTGNAETYLAWFVGDEDSRGDEPEVPDVVKMGVKLYKGRAAKMAKRTTGTRAPFDGVRRNIGKHIEEAFADVEPGTFLTVAQIRSHRSSEYGEDLPSPGAISARLFPHSGKCTVTGITPDTNEKGNKGARKD